MTLPAPKQPRPRRKAKAADPRCPALIEQAMPALAQHVREQMLAQAGGGVRVEREVVSSTIQIQLDPGNVEDYAKFLRIKSLPKYKFTGRTAEFPAEYADLVGLHRVADRAAVNYSPLSGLFDYQRDIAALAIQKRKFAVFVEPGYGKTLIYGEFARHVLKVLPDSRCVLMVAPLMVVEQTIAEYQRFYGGKLPIEKVAAANLQSWLDSGKGRFGITNYEAIRHDTQPGRMGALIIDESSRLKSAYGKQGVNCIRLGKGLAWKLAGTGTPAPNDRIEYANHAVLLDAFPTVNSFLARFFVNRGQTQERWVMKPHALAPFYRALSHWCIFMTNPATYGWKDNAGTLPPIHVHIHDVDLSLEQRAAVMDRTGDMFGTSPGGITSRSVLSQIAKGNIKGRRIETNKPAYIRALVDSWPDESTLIWCIFNAEQELMEKTFPNAHSISGATPHEERVRMIEDFKAGRTRVLISKAEVLGYGLNLQVATRMVFSGLQDSYEDYWQCVKRANRVGSDRALNVHIPITAVERPMIETVLAKAKRVQADTEEQERIFKQEGWNVHAA